MSRGKKEGKGFTRRQFIAGVGAGVAAGGLHLPVVHGQEEPKTDPRVLGPGAVHVEFLLNGRRARVFVEPRVTLLDALRDHLDTTGPKRVCDRGACGSCTVLLDGEAVNACMLLAVDAAGREVTTIEGLTPEEGLSPLQASFVRCDALQCGFCTPGMITSATALLTTNPKPDAEAVRAALSGNLCRCGAYPRIQQAVIETGEGR